MFAWGNPSRGDDGVGPWFADHFRCRAGESLAVVEGFQLQVEHLLDCRAADLLLFLDARCDQPGDYRFERVNVGEGLSHTSHALSPGELLGCFARVFPGEQPPPAFQLTVPGNDFELGQVMSAATQHCCEQAAVFIESLLAAPERDRWCALANPTTARYA